jgi:hypothetical protein
LNGLSPVANCNKTHPNPQISVLKLKLPFNYSGGIYLIVPAVAALVCSLVSSNLFDTPKSISLIVSYSKVLKMIF